MARVTVEDCVEKVPNRFELVLLAGQRSRDIANGSELQLDRDRDKNPVVALREIAEDKLDVDGLKDSLVRGLQRHVEQDEPEEEDMLEMAAAALLSEESEGTSGAARPQAEEDADEGDEPSADDAKAAAAAEPRAGVERPGSERAVVADGRARDFRFTVAAEQRQFVAWRGDWFVTHVIWASPVGRTPAPWCVSGSRRPGWNRSRRSAPSWGMCASSLQRRPRAV